MDGPFAAEVTKVRDGDTLEVRVATWLDQSVEVAIRIDGIDTPEKNGKCEGEKALAAQASEAMRSLIADPRVLLFDVHHDKYAGRALARVVTPDGTDVGREMIRRGLARPYHGEKKLSWCQIAAARTAKGKP
jgi:endonuclease YncB( thermonuclease family)